MPLSLRIAAHSVLDVVATHDEHPVTGAELAARVFGLRRALRERGARACVIACADRLHVAVAYTACLASDVLACFPASFAAEEVARVAREHDAVILRDTDGRDGIDIRGIALEDEAMLPFFASEHDRCVFHTSGTSGAPTAHEKSTGQIFAEVDALAALLPVDAGALVVPTVGAHHLYGFLFGVALPLRVGATFTRETDLDAASVQRSIGRHARAVIVSTPVHLRVLAELFRPADSAAPALVVSSAAPLPPTDAARIAHALGAHIIDVLGSTETGGIATRRDGNETYTPIPGVGIEVDHDGRLSISSPFLPAGCSKLRTNDRVARLANGELVHFGRLDDVVKIGGRRVALIELETALRAMDGISDAAVRLEPSTQGRGTRIVAAVVSQARSADDIRTELRTLFDAAVVPRVIAVVQGIERTTAGKVTDTVWTVLLGRVPRSTVADMRFDLRPISIDPVRFEAYVAPNHPVFAGHFPTEPILPGIVQLSEIVMPAVRTTWPELRWPRGSRRIKFMRAVRPMETLVLRLSRPTPSRVSFELTSSELLCAAGDLEYVLDA